MNDIQQRQKQQERKELINLIGGWFCVVICVLASIYFAAQGKNDYAFGFGIGAFYAWFMFL